MRYYDNTRLTDFKDCPRKYYFRHCLGWRREGIALPLVFGLAWHDAMDVVWALISKHKDPRKVHALAYERFCETWIDEGAKNPNDLTDDDLLNMEPRTPGIAAEMLWEYIQARTKYIQNCELIAIEQPFAVPLKSDDQNLFYIGRLDKVVREKDGRIYIIEHKTTAWYKGRAPEHSFRDEWLDQWSPNSQIDGYLHAGHMLYGDQLKAVKVDGALVHKKTHDKFKYVTVERALEHMEGWLYDAQRWVDAVDLERAALDYIRANRAETIGDLPAIMAAFPKNTGSCFGKYGTRCGYYDLCRFWENPEGRDVPEHYKVEFWNPFDVLDIEKLGLEEEVLG